MTWISPSYTDQDFDWPLSVEDKIEIFRDRTLGWQLEVADNCINDQLASMRHAGFAVLFIVFCYFEMIAQMQAGVVSDGGTTLKYFERGVLSVFPELQSEPELMADILKILYRSARNGFYHNGMARRRISICGDYLDALAYDADIRCVLINPHRLIPKLISHFKTYITALSDPLEEELRKNFETVFDEIADMDPLENE